MQPKKLLILIGIIFLLGGAFSFLVKTSKTFWIEGALPFLKKEGSSQQLILEGKVSPISGLPCKNYNRRPFAVMLAEDSVARPLSGISLADLVIEMPVVTGQINRMMAVYVCENPPEIGSIRSARHDFIPLAQGFDAIFAHWGGSHFAQEILRKGVIDNIDALPNPYQAFYRKSEISPPHNGFTSMERLLNAAQKLGYRLENRFEGYPHLKMTNDKFQITNVKGILEIGYSYPYNLKYEYDPETNSYWRWRGDSPEIDKLNGEQAKAKNIVIIKAESRQIEGEYNEVDIEGGGEAIIYRNGEETKGVWRKDKNNPANKLYFLDKTGSEIEFVPGTIWIEVVEPSQGIKYQKL